MQSALLCVHVNKNENVMYWFKWQKFAELTNHWSIFTTWVHFYFTDVI